MTLTFDEAIQRRTCERCKRTIHLGAANENAPPYLCAECADDPSPNGPEDIGWSPADRGRAPLRFQLPPGAKPTGCRGCGAAIYFTRTQEGKWLPIDGDGTPHWASCPAASKFRRRR